MPKRSYKRTPETIAKMLASRTYVKGEDNPLWKPRVKRICHFCKKEFERLLSHLKQKNGGKFCSHQCLFDSRKIRANKECPNCKKNFEFRVHIFKRNKKLIFCSKNCFLEYTSGKIDLICKCCNERYWTYSSHKKWRGSSFCSRKCRVKFSVGKNHPAWKGGPKARKVRDASSYRYIQWRNKVFKRDNWTCQVCNARSAKGNPVSLRSHHIKSWAKYPKLRFIIKNGITLCAKCHYKAHSRKGLRQLKTEGVF